MNIRNLQQKWYVIDSESKGDYSHHDRINVLAKSIESGLCDYFDAYILVMADITATRTIAAAVNNHLQRKQPLASGT